MLLQLQHISKSFGGVTALRDVSLHIEAGEVHALCGENGAGKSTLMNILSGNQQPTSSKILMHQQPVIISNPIQAHALGIAIVHQEKSLAEGLSIAENIFPGRQPVNKWGLINYTLLNKRVIALLNRIQLFNLPPRTLVKELSSAQQQMVEIAKALSCNPRILILDEPTAVVSGKETELLFSIIKTLKEENVTVIYISHRLREIFSISDKVTVLKDGRYQGTKITSETNTNELIKLMVGRDIQQLPANHSRLASTALKVEKLCGPGFENISLSVNKGEIVGLAGLVGAGRTEIAKSIFGAAKLYSGKIFINNKQITITNTANSIKQGISYIPEDRKSQGAFLEMSVAENIIAAKMPAANKNNLFSCSRMLAISETYKTKLNIVTPNVKQPVKLLSGGNQQKTVIAKWLLADTDILIADEPTQGVDVGARFEIYQLLLEEAARGKSILLISSELPELLLLCDTIHVVHKGRLTKSFPKEDATEEKIMQAAAAD
ncbi:MAG: sugar ABC transporter ATP-binding protein [Ferruginibacter sp.]